MIERERKETRRKRVLLAIGHGRFQCFTKLTFPFLFNSTPLLLPTLSLHTHHLFSYPPLLQAEEEMKGVEAALKTSIRKEMTVKSSPQVFIDDLLALNLQNGAPCDDFFVDDLLDFSNEHAMGEEELEEVDYKAGYVSVSPQPEDPSCEIFNPGLCLSAKDNFVSATTSELSVPDDDLAGLRPESHAEKGPELEIPVLIKPCFKPPVPAKARSKRTRTGGRVWSLGSPSLSQSSSSSSSSASSSPPSPSLIYTNITQSFEQVSKPPPAKKPKKRPVSAMAGSGGTQTSRRCSHCGVQKTPQWRAGPLGAKTLCNACGVRFKSGRLLPEYRPACSPTFSSGLHSNHHRKVLEMRRNKETIAGVESGLTPPVVPSF
ncbi:GATA transcription factor [Quillaja saponaria]|uniref:GATA transcription factor n=1 Tax=Quillaja saponaria TaxID=32244 RepID=A0AAD7L8C2_QUISA|nr:GATA transcription factor [Quillaja saponaria]